MQRYDSMVYTAVVCPSVRLSVRPSQIRVQPKWLNIESRKQCHTTAQGLGEILMGQPPMGARQIQVGWVKINDFRQYLTITHKQCKIET